MDTNGTNASENTVVEGTSLRHQVGKTVVGSIAAFAANRLAEKGYDKALAFYRSRRSA
jgi:hypothetical protein